MTRKSIYTDANIEDLTLKGKDWNFHENEEVHPLHKIHPYPARFIPQIPRKAILEYSSKGDLIYDPFCGCGTTLLEANLLGRNAIGTDNNKVAALTSEVKTKIYSKKEIFLIEKFISKFKNCIINETPRKELIPYDPNFHNWYDENIVNHLSKIKSIILKYDSPVKELLLVIFSSILVRVSFQDSDTRYARVNRIVKTEEVDNFLLNKLKTLVENLNKLNLRVTGQSEVKCTDSRKVDFIADESINCIITSPPYLNAYDYHKYHRQRLHWLEADIPFTRKTEIGSHDTFTRKNATPKKYFKDMHICINEWQRVLKTSSYCLIVIGDSIVSKTPVKVADQLIDIFVEEGFSLKNRFIRELKKSNKSFNLKNSRINSEHILIFQKR